MKGYQTIKLDSSNQKGIDNIFTMLTANILMRITSN